LSVGYLVYDRIYETGATVSSVASDPTNPFYFPFAIANNSHVFSLRHIEWSCHVVKMTAGGNDFTDLTAFLGGDVDEIRPGGVLNVSCRRAVALNGLPVTNLVLEIDLQYDADIFGIMVHRSPPAIPFTWAADATNPQWIRGELVQ
jgi:hypothetical protein